MSHRKGKPAPAARESRPPTTKNTDLHHPAGCTHSNGPGERVRCRHCRRPLRVALSVVRQSGPTCWRKSRGGQAVAV
jgi:hypothetical protein